MPEIIRLPTRMDCDGLDVMHPADRMPPKTFPVLQNARVVEEGRLESRPGYTPYDTGTRVHSMRRLNDPADLFNTAGYTNIVGDGNLLRAGPQGALVTVDQDYSGHPLSLLTFRPDQSPETWMYVYDQNKQAKVRPDGVVQPIGVPPPATGPIANATYGPPANIDASTGQATAGWAPQGGAGAVTLGDRASQMSTGTGLTIGTILYDSGTTGWCVIVPASGTPGDLVPDQMGNRMKVILQTGPETVLVREVHADVGTTTIAGIQYDLGNNGVCTIVLASQPAGGNLQALTRNSVLRLGGTEYVRVLSVTLSPDGSTYSIRCSTLTTHFAGDAVAGALSWYCYTVGTHAAGETIASHYIYAAVASATPVTSSLLAASLSLNLGTAASRPIDPANDWMHISFYIDAPQNLGYLLLQIYIGTGAANDYYGWTVTADTLSSGWNEILLPIASADRVGAHTGDSLSNSTGLQVFVQSNGPLTFGFDWWYLFGTYGPTVQPNSPVGLSYVSTNRNSGTGAASVPSPPLRFQLFPLREQVLVTPQPNALAYNGVPYVDKLDIWRLGGSITNFTYVGTVANNALSPQIYADNLPDTSIESSPQADFTLIQPWPVLVQPRSGTVNVVGTKVTWNSGDYFDLTLLSASVILINGIAFQTYGQSRIGTDLELFLNAGVQTNVPYQIASPTLAAQPLPLAFGPLEGPLAPVAFALGDLVNAGTLYYSNISNLDAASDQNTVEIAPPGEPLISGAVWNGYVIVGSRENLYIARYSYLQTLGVPGQTTFQFNRLPTPSGGMWSRWSVCAGADGVYFLGRDGIYRATEQGAVSITDHRLYPLFPHDGEPARTSYGLLPVNMSNLPALRLSAADEDVYFDYSTASGAS